MPQKDYFQVDTREFDAALRAYIPHSKRTFADIVNKRGVNVAFKATRFTQKARPSKIRRDMRRPSRNHPGAPLGAVLVNKGRSPGLQGPDMRDAVDRLTRAKERSIGFIKSGWLGAVNDLQPHAKVRRRPPKVNVRGRPQGYARPARPGIAPAAEIVNHVPGAAEIGAEGLQRALNADARDMAEYVARRMQADANKWNAR